MVQYGRRDYETSPQEKPYRFVDLPSGAAVESHRQPPAGHAVYTGVSGTLIGEITVRTPVHLGSGKIELTGQKDIPLVKAHVRSGGRPVIPGSSLKGAVRSVVEAISPSCVHITQARQYPRAARRCDDLDRLCVACRMFGALGRQGGYQGLVRFCDAVLRKEHDLSIVSIPVLYAPRTRERLYFDDVGQVKGRKFYRHGHLAVGDMPMEVCPIGAKLDLIVHFSNLTEKELGLLLIALGQGDRKFWLKLGGGKPRCAGSVEISVTEMKTYSDAAATYASYEAETDIKTLQDYLEAGKELVLAAQLNQLAEILKAEAQWACPDRNY